MRKDAGWMQKGGTAWLTAQVQALNDGVLAGGRVHCLSEQLCGAAVAAKALVHVRLHATN